MIRYPAWTKLPPLPQTDNERKAWFPNNGLRNHGLPITSISPARRGNRWLIADFPYDKFEFTKSVPANQPERSPYLHPRTKSANNKNTLRSPRPQRNKQYHTPNPNYQVAWYARAKKGLDAPPCFMGPKAKLSDALRTGVMTVLQEDGLVPVVNVNGNPVDSRMKMTRLPEGGYRYMRPHDMPIDFYRTFMGGGDWVRLHKKFKNAIESSKKRQARRDRQTQQAIKRKKSTK